MLVIEDWNGSAVFLKNLRDLLKELVTGIEFLTEFVGGIVAVLADNKDRVHRESFAATAKGFRDGWIDLEAKFLGTFAAQVVFRGLIDINRDHVQRWSVPFTPDRIADEETLAHVPGMRAGSPLGRDHGHPLSALFLRLGRSPRQWQTDESWS